MEEHVKLQVKKPNNRKKPENHKKDCLSKILAGAITKLLTTKITLTGCEPLMAGGLVLAADG